MDKITTINSEEFENISMDLYELFEDSFRDEFDISKEEFLNKTIYDKNFCSYASALIYDDKKLFGGIIIKVEEDNAWISFISVKKEYRNLKKGKKLFEYAQQRLIENNIKRITVGQDYNHIFSGIPSPTEETKAFFINCGFTLNTKAHYDVSSDLQKNEIIDKFDVSLPKGFIIEECHSFEESFGILLKKEFNLRWFNECKEFVYAENKKVMLLKYENEIAGFCVLTIRGKKGGLGPVGMSYDFRKKGLGAILIVKSLSLLKNLGIGNTCIDWTILDKYYGQFGFKISREYLSAVKENLSV